MGNVESVQTLYEAFGRGDIPAVLDLMADDVEWESWGVDNTAQEAGVPWLRRRRGREGVAEFFDVVGTFEIRDFQILGFLDGGDTVAVDFMFDAIAPTGEHLHDEEIHLYDFDENGRVTRMRHYVDTAKHIKVARVGAEAPA
jgi:ketosteroid isomerase-like protein